MRRVAYLGALLSSLCIAGITEAPTGLYDRTNGLTTQTQFDSDREPFDEVESLEEGLGPIYNAQSCRECHQNPTSGGASQITELRVGHRDARGIFQAPSIPIAHGQAVITNRTLVNDRATCPSREFSDVELQQRAPETETIHALRLSLPLFGDGLIEVIEDAAIVRNAQAQCADKKSGICGQPMIVPVVEFPGATAVGRFGWKAQHASIHSFTGDAYLNEMGITNPLFPDELTGICSAAESHPNDPSGEARGSGGDTLRIARFIRALQPPNRDEALKSTPEAQQGSELFDTLNCSECHKRDWVTQPAGTIMHGRVYSVASDLGDKLIHPYSDFLLHDVGTGDGIEVIAAEHFGKKVRGKNTVGVANKLRTPPLWGLRLRPRMMHDGLSVTLGDAIRRHKNEGQRASNAFNALSAVEQQALYQFLRSL